MGLNAKASLVTDQYERAARLYPALLTILPLLIVQVTASVLGKPLVTQLAALLGSCGVTYLLANVSRMLGKAQEHRLFLAWGGMPTTQMLRHGNELVDLHTKQRYHAFLARKIKVEFPTSANETASPAAADDIYRAGVKWLLGKTRDKKRFALLFKENVSYGFHRNGFGLRWIGFLFSLLSIVWLTIANQTYSAHAWLALSAGQIATMGIAVAMTFAWLAYFTEARVKQAAYAYAEMLLRACDELR